MIKSWPVCQRDPPSDAEVLARIATAHHQDVSILDSQRFKLDESKLIARQSRENNCVLMEIMTLIACGLQGTGVHVNDKCPKIF